MLLLIIFADMYWVPYWYPLYLARYSILNAAAHRVVTLENLNIYIKDDGYHLSNANVFQSASLMHIIPYHRIQCGKSWLLGYLLFLFPFFSFYFCTYALYTFSCAMPFIRYSLTASKIFKDSYLQQISIEI